jgi:hypothetical protein
MRGKALIERGRVAKSTPRLREGVFVRRTAVLVMALLLALLSVVFIASSRRGARAADASPCGTLALSSTNYSHVIWVWMENHSYDTIIGSPEAPNLNSLASQCGLAINYHNISHPSLPNYIAATSGLSREGVTRFTPDCQPSRKCSTTASSIFSQIPSWRAYEESMPKSCDRKSKSEYAVRHNPPPYYKTLTECGPKDVPYTQLAGDIADGTLPAFSFVTPNLIDDMHDGTVAQGDAWLQSSLATILSSSEYKSGTVVIVITWDEGEGGSSGDCSTNTTDVGCHVATIVVSPSTAPGTESSTLFNHYSLLASTEQLLGVPPLGEAARANSMLAAFNL